MFKKLVELMKNVTNSNGIYDSKEVDRSSGVTDSFDITLSNGVRLSGGVIESDAISLSNGVSWSFGVHRSKGVNESYGVYWSYGVNESRGVNQSEVVNLSYGVYWSHGVNESGGVNHSSAINASYGVNESFGVINSYGVDCGLFVADKKRTYTLFNKKVSEIRFNEVWDTLHNKLNDWFPKFNNSFELHEQAEGGWKKVNSGEIRGTLEDWEEPYEAWKDMPKEAIEYLKSLPEFEADIFKRVTGIDVEKEEVGNEK